jgi:cytochrome c-type biogenesis protein CcmH
MAVFWMLAGLMTVVALAFVLVPLLRARPPAGPTAMEANLEVLRGQRRELEADIASGVIPADARNEALAELVTRAEADLAAPAAAVAAERKRPWAAVAIAAVGIPALAFGVYLAIGSPAATDPRIASTGVAEQKDMTELVDRLAQKVRERPDDAKGWALLARSTAALGRFEESARAHERLMKLVPGDAQIMADYADVLGMTQGRTLAGRPFELVKSALEIDPANRKALALAGTAAMEQGRFVESIGYWERLAAVVPPDSDDAKEVAEVLGELRSRAGLPAKASPAVAKAAPAVAKAPAPAVASPAAGKSVSGIVTIAPELAAKVAATDTIFVFARAESGSRAPLAVLRGSARELPLTFALDDTMAMSPQWSLSRADNVRIEARVSKSGNAMPQSGDVIGSSGIVKPGARDVRVVIDKVVP